MENGNAWNANFRLEPKRQNVWNISHASWFFAMGVGGALFLNRLLFGIQLGSWFGFEGADVLGLVLISIGGLILIGDLGKPLRFPRAIVNLRSSWISWGFLADLVFVVGGVVALLGGPAWAAWVAGSAALFVIVYPGFVMAFSPSIPFWNTPLVPLQFLAYAFASASGLALWVGPGGIAAQIVCAASFAFALSFSALHLLGAQAQRGAARLGAAHVARDALFLLAIAVGVVLPLVAALLEVGGTSLGAPFWAAAALVALAANWAVKLSVLRAGYYAPLF